MRGCLVALVAMAAVGCSSSGSDPAGPTPGAVVADVTAVSVSGEPGAYQLAVTVSSDETGCDRYADWWEVASADDGALLYRRILGHSHVDEQPFTRSGGPVAVDGDTGIVVRAHMNPGGYGGAEFHGTAAGGLSRAEQSAPIAEGVESAAPQPDGCAF